MRTLVPISEYRTRLAARYSKDPYWMTAKYPGRDQNGKPFRKGDRVFYYPLTKTILTGPEAEKASREFDAAAFDEDFGFRAATPSGRVAGHSAKDIGPDLIYLVADEAGIPRRSLTGGQYEAIGDAIRDTLRNKSTRAAFARILAAVVDEARDEAESYLDIGGHSFRIGDR